MYHSTILNSYDMPRDVKQTVEANFVASLQRAVSYLEQWFDFSGSNVLSQVKSSQVAFNK